MRSQERLHQALIDNCWAEINLEPGAPAYKDVTREEIAHLSDQELRAAGYRSRYKRGDYTGRTWSQPVPTTLLSAKGGLSVDTYSGALQSVEIRAEFHMDGSYVAKSGRVACDSGTRRWVVKWETSLADLLDSASTMSRERVLRSHRHNLTYAQARRQESLEEATTTLERLAQDAASELSRIATLLGTTPELLETSLSDLEKHLAQRSDVESARQDLADANNELQAAVEQLESFDAEFLGG